MANRFEQFAPRGSAGQNRFAEFAQSRREEEIEKVRAGDAPDYRPPIFGERFDRLTDQVMDPFGVSDEITGAGQFIRRFVTSGGDVSEAAQAYSDAAERVRAERDVAREENTIIPEIVGGFGTTGIAKGFSMAPTLGGRVAQSARAGGGFGAAAGATQSEGSIPNRLLGAAQGAATGAVLGPVLTEVVAPGIGALVRTGRAGKQGLGRAVGYLRGRQRNIDQRLNRALEQQNMTPQQAIRRVDEAQDAARFGQTQLDPQFAPADLGPVTRDLADTAALVSREARGEAGQFLQSRARGSFGRINDYLKRSLKVTRGDFAKTQNRLTNEQRQLSNQAYEKAYADPNEIDVGQALFDSQFDEFATAGPLRRSLKRARDLFTEPTRGEGFQASLSTARFDSGKRALDDMIQTARNAGRNNEARMLTQLKNELVAEADKVNPAYKAARDVYSSRAELLDALDEGRKFMRGDAEYTGDQYRQLSTGEKRMFRIGLAREVRKKLGNKQYGHDMVGVFDKPNTREVLEEIMTPKQFKKFYDLVQLEEGLAATNRAVRGNSRTAERQQNILDFSLGVRLGRAIKDRGLREALSDEIFDQITKFFAMREDDAVTLTRMLFETDPNAQRAIFNRLAQTYGSRSTRAIANRALKIAQRQMANRRRALAGLAGEEGALLQDQ